MYVHARKLVRHSIFFNMYVFNTEKENGERVK